MRKSNIFYAKSLVATAYVDCTACAPCKQICVEYTTFARKRLNALAIVRLLRVATSSSVSVRLLRAI